MDGLISEIENKIRSLGDIQSWAERMIEKMRNDPEHWPEDARDDLDQVVGYMEDAQHDLMDAIDQYQE